uniref:Uncharacterized protein n=1 Tax=Aegilops tauschii subsp. strangulata TaxID=200361 RepID=A0A453IMH2_AEGTS
MTGFFSKGGMPPESSVCGFLGMLGSIDCMHWSWNNCPKAWHGQFHSQKRGSTIILEAVADQETWIWHAFLECLDL